jgi:hypothetical protein
MEPETPSEKEPLPQAPVMPPEVELPIDSWADIFFCVLFAPMKCFEALGDPLVYPVEKNALLGVTAAVWVAITFDAFAKSILAGEIDHFSVLGSTISGFMLWFTLAGFLRFLSGWTKGNVPYKTCLITTGWAFIPLILKAPFVCLTLWTPLFGILLVSVTLWFFFLQVIAFDSVLKLGRMRTVTLMVAVPALFAVVYIVWTGCLILLLLSALARA